MECKKINMREESKSEPLESVSRQKASFVEKWGRTEETNGFLRVTLYGLIGFCIILLFAVFKMATKPQPVYYIPGARDAGISYPNRIEKGSIGGFATSWLLNRTNFTPATVEDVYTRATRYMSPELLSKTRGSLDEETKRVQRDSVSSLFSLAKEPEIEESDAGYKVLLTGEAVLYMGKEKLDTRTVKYIISLERVPPTEINPYGLVISGVKQEQLKGE
jgi:hypothetical protein